MRLALFIVLVSSACSRSADGPPGKPSASAVWSPARPFYGPNPAAEAHCRAGGAVYASFPNDCADACGPRQRLCGQAMTDACDCGPGKCWDGTRCVAD